MPCFACIMTNIEAVSFIAEKPPHQRLVLGKTKMKNKLFIILAIVLTSVSTGYSLEITKTIGGKPVIEQEPNLNGNVVAEMLPQESSSESSIVTVEKRTFNIEYRGAESLINEIINFKDMNNSN